MAAATDIIKNNGLQYHYSSGKNEQKHTIRIQLPDVLRENRKCEKTRGSHAVSLNKYLWDVNLGEASNPNDLYVYDGNDKKSLSASSMIENLGEYFKRNSYYVDIEGGKWSPTTFNVIPSILYCVFVLQSFMFLFSYIKRLLYVVILSMLGPVTVIYDYIAKGYR